MVRRRVSDVTLLGDHEAGQVEQVLHHRALDVHVELRVRVQTARTNQITPDMFECRLRAPIT